MSLIIRQGKQDTSKDGIFEPIVEKDVIMAIVGLKLCDPAKFPDTLEVEFKIIASENNLGRKVWDRVNFSPTSDFSWKYRSLRKAAGCPYSEDESEAVDIEGLLLNRAVGADLGVREGTKDGVTKKYQSITYKEIKNSEEGDTLDDDTNPFASTTDEFAEDEGEKEAEYISEQIEAEANGENPSGEYMPANLADASDFT